MRQVLFWIPVPGVEGGIPLYGYGVMLCIGYLLGIWQAGRLAERQGIARRHVQDLAMYILIFGIVGARTTYLLIQERVSSVGEFISAFPRLWDGGIILYGALLGAMVGYVVAYRIILRPHRIPNWKLGDAMAPAIALGLSVWRIGCLLNGCCYGTVDHVHWRSVHFPLPAPARLKLTADGLQTAAGFLTPTAFGQPASVTHVAHGSPAESAGLRPGDVIEAIGAFDPLTGQRRGAWEIADEAKLEEVLVQRWPRGTNGLALTVRRAGERLTLPVCVPRTLGLHPTQLYETISMALLYLLLMAYYPLRTNPGQVLALFSIGYGAHRYLNEQLRSDLRPGMFELAISAAMIGGGLAVWVWKQRTAVASTSGETAKTS